MDLAGSQTYENLKKAFARESDTNRRYLWFAQLADVDGHPQIATLFRSVAEAETGHAFGHLEFLAEVADPTTGHPLGETAENLKAAIAGEVHDHDEMYPDFAAVARDEGLEEIAAWFETLIDAERNQAERLRRGLDELA